MLPLSQELGSTHLRGSEVLEDSRMNSRFAVGDWVFYRKLEHSATPDPRARNISPALRGESYSYFIENLLIVQAVLADGRLRLRTYRGQSLLIDTADPNLRRVPWWKRWFYSYRFRKVQTSSAFK